MLPKSNMPLTSSGRKNIIRNMYSDDDSPLTGISFSHTIFHLLTKFLDSFKPSTPMTDGTTTAPLPRVHHIDYASITLPDQIDVSGAVRHHLNLPTSQDDNDLETMNIERGLEMQMRLKP